MIKSVILGSLRFEDKAVNAPLPLRDLQCSVYIFLWVSSFEKGMQDACGVNTCVEPQCLLRYIYLAGTSLSEFFKDFIRITELHFPTPMHLYTPRRPRDNP